MEKDFLGEKIDSMISIVFIGLYISSLPKEFEKNYEGYSSSKESFNVRHVS